jgi:hypothetical protein
MKKKQDGEEQENLKENEKEFNGGSLTITNKTIEI